MEAPPVQYATTSDGVSIAWTEFGSGPMLLYVGPFPFCHLQDHRSAFGVFFEALERSFRVINFDARGFGMSERDVTEVSAATLLKDAEAVLDAASADRVIVFADISQLAASIALQLATAHPERVTHLVLESPFQNVSEVADTPVARLGPALAEADWDIFVQTHYRVLNGWDGNEPWFEPVVKAVAGWLDASVGRQYIRLLQALDFVELLPRVTQPTLIIRMEPGPIPARACQRFTAQIPGAQFQSYKDSTFLKQAELTCKFVGVPVVTADAPSITTMTGRTEMTRRLADVGETQSFAAGRYVVIRPLGEGGQKSVYLVHDSALDRDCALALIRSDDLEPDDLLRFQREAQAMARLGAHSNIVSVFDIGEQDGRPFLVSEYIAGGDLRQLLLKRGRLPLDEALAIGGDIARALAAAHARGVIHRDVKPLNIWLTEDGVAKLGDFGLAFSLGGSRLTMPGTVMGTAAYLAPEQALGQPVTERSDLYALGCLLYEMVCGRPPFNDTNPTAVIAQHINAVPTAPSSHEPDVPPLLEGLILRLLAKSPAQRPDSAAAVLEELRRMGHTQQP